MNNILKGRRNHTFCGTFLQLSRRYLKIHGKPQSKWPATVPRHEPDSSLVLVRKDTDRKTCCGIRTRVNIRMLINGKEYLIIL